MAKKPVPVVEDEETNPYIKGKLPIGELIDKLDENRAARRPLEAAMKPLEADYKLLKEAILQKLFEQKLEKQGTSKATVSVSRVTVPVLDDIEALIKYLVRTKNLHVLLGQPMSTPSWRELVERKGGDLPGSHTFVKIDLNHASIKS